MENKMFNQIKLHRKMSNIDRLSDVLKNRKYSLAEHSYYVLTMFQDFAILEDLEYSQLDLYKIARHDFLEIITADIASPILASSPAIRDAWQVIEQAQIKTYKDKLYSIFNDSELQMSLDSKKVDLLIACDLLELYLFCLEDFSLGNTSAEMVRIIKLTGQKIRDLKIESVNSFMSQVTKEQKEQLQYYR